MKFFKYICYSISDYWYKDDDSFRGCIILGGMQTVFLSDILLLAQIFQPFLLRDYIQDPKLWGLMAFLTFTAINYMCMKPRYASFSKHWRETETPAQRRVRGWLVLLTAFSPLILFLSIFIVFGEYGPARG